METIKITGKDGRVYIIEIDKNSFKIKQNDREIIWELEYKIFDKIGELQQIGKIKADHTLTGNQISNNEALELAIKAGIKSIRRIGVFPLEGCLHHVHI